MVNSILVPRSGMEQILNDGTTGKVPACLLSPNKLTDPSVPDSELSMWHLEMTLCDPWLAQWGL